MAITGQLTVTPEELERQAEQVRSACTELNNKFNRIKDRVLNTSNFWKGDAAEAHREAYTRNQSTIDEILDRYREHIRDLEAMAGVYREAETTAKNLADELPAITI